MKFSFCLILSALLAVSLAQISPEDSQKFATCSTEQCQKLMESISPNLEQVNENYKIAKCINGQKSQADTKDVSADTVQDDKCKTITDFAAMAECYKACVASQLTGENPFIEYYNCQVGCMETSSPSSSSVLVFSMVVLSIVLSLF